jgi:pimeloyl-ACP methyl ester carboxylesterase
MPYVQLSGLRMFYADRSPVSSPEPGGAAVAPAVLVHGLWDSADTWVHQLAHLRTRRRTLAPDLRGHGRTGRSGDDYSTERHAADLEQFIERLIPGPAVLIGHSMGASVISVLSARRPDLVHALVSIDPDYAGSDASRPRMRALADALDGSSAEEVALRIVTTLARGPETPAELVERIRQAVLGLGADVRARTFRHNAFHPGSVRFLPEARPVLCRRRAPVLALHRDPARMRADEECFGHPASEAVLVLGAGHFLAQEIPGRVNAEIDRWLAESTARGVAVRSTAPSPTSSNHHRKGR